MKKTVRLLLALLLLASLLALPALADDTHVQDTAGNRLFSDEFKNARCSLDLYGGGESVYISGSEIGESIIVFGRDISVTDTILGGSLRLAGYNLAVNDVTADVNATLAGYSINLGGGFECRGVFAACSDLTFAGRCSSLCAAASSVTLTGTVDGSAYISANSVTIGDGAVVTGTLTVDSPNQPVVASGAKIGRLVHNVTTSDSTDVEEGEAHTVSPVVSALKKLARGIPAVFLLALLFHLVIPGSVKKSGEMITARPLPMLLTGLVWLICVPIASIVLMITVIGAPVGLLLLAMYILALCFALSFTAYSVARRVLPGLHWLLCALIGAAAFKIVSVIPYLGGLLTFACMLYTLGYFLQVIYLGFPKKHRAQPIPAPEAPQSEFSSSETPVQLPVSAPVDVPDDAHSDLDDPSQIGKMIKPPFDSEDK